MTGHLLDEATLAVIRRTFYNLTQVAARQPKDPRSYQELDRAFTAAVEGLGSALAHIEAVEEADASELAYAGLNYVDKWERWHDTPDDRPAFDAMCEAQTALRDAAVMYTAGVEG